MNWNTVSIYIVVFGCRNKKSHSLVIKIKFYFIFPAKVYSIVVFWVVLESNTTIKINDLTFINDLYTFKHIFLNLNSLKIDKIFIYFNLYHQGRGVKIRFSAVIRFSRVISQVFMRSAVLLLACQYNKLSNLNLLNFWTLISNIGNIVCNRRWLRIYI